MPLGSQVRCIFPNDSRQCLNCRRNQWNCVAESTPAIRDSASAIIPLEYPVDVLDSIPDAWHSAVDQRPNLVSQKLPTGSRLLRQAGYMQADNSTAAEIQANGYSPMEGEGPSADDIGILRAQHVFDLPSSAVSDSLIETFMERCQPWMPVVERSWLVESDTNKPSILLLQAVFLAACRVSSAPTVIAYASPVEFYRRAKAIFYSGYEKDPLILIAVTCILQWYNPDGPEHVSINTSTMWRYIGVGLAHQIGLHKEPPPGEGASLRRRLWWSLYARDCLISSAHGRPLAINIEDCDVRSPCREDFDISTLNADLFIAYVEICSLLGQLTQCCCRGSLSRRIRKDIESALLRWVCNLPVPLRLFQTPSPGSPTYGRHRMIASPYNFEARQLHVPYFVILAILFQSSFPGNCLSSVSILASSAITWIVESFLARDEIRLLSPTFIFYLVVAARSLLPCYRHPSMLDLGPETDIQTIHLALKELGKQWPSANQPSRELESIAEDIKRLQLEERPPIIRSLSSYEWPFFSPFAPCISWAWDHVVSDTNALMGHQPRPRATPGRNVEVHRTTMTAGILAEPTTPIASPGAIDAHATYREISEAQSSDDPGHGQYAGFGDWILKDWDWSLGSTYLIAVLFPPLIPHSMTDSPVFRDLSLERHGNVFVITLQKDPENRLNSWYCQEIIRAFRTVEKLLGPGSEGAVITRGSNAKFWCTGVELDEAETNPFATTDGFYPLLHVILDFPFPTIALLTGHTFGGACPLALAHDYRVMNSRRGFISMPPVDLGLHFNGIGSLPRLKLSPPVARKMLLEACRWTGKEALQDGIVDLIAEPEQMFDVALELARKWASKAKMG
ncbi:Acetamidase regulatory protein [Talaromyces pinophilus]|nr:Acetamidase regulatory protein [Talaromyces pinophilus]